MDGKGARPNPAKHIGKSVSVNQMMIGESHSFYRPIKNKSAVALGKLGGPIGGRAKSEAKTLAARANAKKPRPNARKKKQDQS